MVAVSLEEASEPRGRKGVQKPRSAVSPAERKVLQDLLGVLRKPEVKSSEVDKILHIHLGKSSVS